jgi:hypothetical protein
MSPAALALLLVLPSATGGRWGVGLSSDVQGGFISVAPGQPTRPTMSTTVTPQFSLSLQGSPYTLRLAYGMRVFRRFELDPVEAGTPLPNGELAIRSLDRFLLLHTLGVSGTARLAAGWSFSSNANITLGEVDVPSAAGYLQNSTGAGTTPQTPGQPVTAPTTDPSLGGLPTDDGVIETIAVATNAAFSGALTRDWTLDLIGTLSHSRPISAPDGSGPGLRFIPIQTNITGATNLGYKLTSKDTLKLGLTVGYNLSDFGGDYRALGGTVGWARRLGAWTTLGVNGGVQYTSVLQQSQNNLGRALNVGSSFSPLASVTLSTVLANLRWTRWSAGVSGVISQVRNPVAGFIEPRAGGSVVTSLAFLPAWTVAINATFTTPASNNTCTPANVSGNAGQALASQFCLAETNLQVRVPVSYRVGRGFSISAGGAFQAYAPRFNAQVFGFNNPSYTAFAQLSIALDQAM